MRKYIGPVVIGILALVFLFGGAVVGLYTDWLWFSDLGYGQVFSTKLVTQLGLGTVMGLLFFAIVYGNLWYARRIAPPPSPMGIEQQLVERLGSLARRGIGLVIFAGSVILSVLVAFAAASFWEQWLLYRNSTPFGVTDPVHGLDIGFYVFQLPFVQYLYGWLFFALMVATIASVAIHYADEAIEVFGNRLQFAPRVKAHLAILVSAMFFLKAAGYRLSTYSLVYAQREQFDGAGFTDVFARIPVLNIMMVVAAVGGLLVLLNIFRRGIAFAAAGLVLVIAASIVVGGVYPFIIQEYTVKPNELEKESPFIARAITATQQAYGLKTVQVRDFQADTALTAAQLQANSATIENIRLWDQKHLQDAYSQIQTLQQYYSFNDVDVDRYWLTDREGGEPRYRQVWLSARELQQSALPEDSQTWVNRHLQYTHGYGFAMSPVNEVSAEGLPEFFVYDIPPKTRIAKDIKSPEVYFGELTDQHVFVDTSASEFDYPTGSETKETSYEGDRGVGIGNLARRLAFAVRFQDINILLNSNFRPESKVLFRREIQERMETALPFLHFDSDPYLVVADGKMYWMRDAYTLTDRYPYSEHVRIRDRAANYIRNSVKVVADAYTGDVDAYVIEEPLPDPIIRTYQKIYPAVFKPISEMPQTLRDHIRYPEDLFRVQTFIYQRYHMSNPKMFYNQSDLWGIPERADLISNDAADAENTMEPYHVIMRLPNGEREEFILMTPYTRAGKKNMVAWLAAKCDGKNYGTLVLYQFPKDKNVYGPQQIAARARQDTVISQQLTLWSREGSSVSSGNLLVVPIDNSLLYVMPVYLESTQTKIPELKQVLVALGNRVAMRNTLEEALSAVVGESVRTAPERPARPTQPGGTPERPEQPQFPGAVPSDDIIRLIDQAQTQYDRAEAAQRTGDWAEYGKQIKALKATLEQLKSISD